MIKSNFREWNLDKIEDAFGLVQEPSLPKLDNFLSYEYELDDFEKKYLVRLRDSFMLGGEDWNEFELENKFISPLIVFSEISNRQFSYFLEREMAVVIGEYALSGKVDGMVATGFRSPKKPYFCLNEYKRGTDPDGDPKGQVLIAMLAAQHLNDTGNKNADRPIFGCFVIGKLWHFVLLEDKKYAISNGYICDDDEIFDIYRILRGLRWHIEQLLLN